MAVVTSHVRFCPSFIIVFFLITFALFSIIDICKLLCVCVKGVILNEDLMMMMMIYVWFYFLVSSCLHFFSSSHSLKLVSLSHYLCLSAFSLVTVISFLLFRDVPVNHPVLGFCRISHYSVLL